MNLGREPENGKWEKATRSAKLRSKKKKKKLVQSGHFPSQPFQGNEARTPSASAARPDYREEKYHLLISSPPLLVYHRERAGGREEKKRKKKKKKKKMIFCKLFFSVSFTQILSLSLRDKGLENTKPYSSIKLIHDVLFQRLISYRVFCVCGSQ